MKDIVFITSCSQILYENQIYGRCLDSWNLIPFKKILFSEDGLILPDFEIINLNELIDRYNFFKTKKRKGVVRRFYRKALSIYYSLKYIDARYIVWVDADVQVKKSLDVWPEFVEPLASMFYARTEEEASDPQNYKQYGLDTGMIIFDKEKIPVDFADRFIDYWHSEKIYDYRGKDTTVLTDMLKNHDAANLIKKYIYLPSGSNYFELTEFNGYLEHYIGKGKK